MGPIIERGHSALQVFEEDRIFQFIQELDFLFLNGDGWDYKNDITEIGEVPIYSSSLASLTKSISISSSVILKNEFVDRGIFESFTRFLE